MKKYLIAAGTTMSAVVASVMALPPIAYAADLTVNTPKGFATNPGSLLTGVLRIVLVIAALLVFFYLILGGIEYITSGGEKGKTEAARNKITSAIIGLIILAASYAILTLALNFLGYSDLNNLIQTNVNNTTFQ